MIIYKSPSGDGFNPFLPFSLRLHRPLRLRRLTRTTKISAGINLVLSMLLMISGIAWTSGILAITALHAALAATALVTWRLVSFVALRSEFFDVAELPEIRVFRLSLFTADWSIFYMTLSLYLMICKTSGPHQSINIALTVLVGLCVALMLLPLAQGSALALANTPRATDVDAE